MRHPVKPRVVGSNVCRVVAAGRTVTSSSPTVLSGRREDTRTVGRHVRLVRSGALLEAEAESHLGGEFVGRAVGDQLLLAEPLDHRVVVPELLLDLGRTPVMSKCSLAAAATPSLAWSSA